MTTTIYIAILKSILGILSIVMTGFYQPIYFLMIVLGALLADMFAFYWRQQVGQISKLDKQMKLACDNIFIALLFIVLSQHHLLFVWVTLTFVSLQFLILGVYCYTLSKNIQTDQNYFDYLVAIFFYIGVFGLILGYMAANWILILATIFLACSFLKNAYLPKTRKFLSAGLAHKKISN